MKTQNYPSYFLPLLFLSFSFTGIAQDQFFMNPSQSLVYLNPSFAGSNGGIRNQFSYISNPSLAAEKKDYNTYVNNFDFYLKPLKAGIAVSATSDILAGGRLKNSGLGLAYAQYLTIADKQLKIVPSVQAVYQQRVLDLTKLTFYDLIDPRYGIQYTSPWTMPIVRKNYVSMDAGLLLNYKEKLFAGLSVAHINQPDIGMAGPFRLPAQLNAHVSYNLPVSEKSLLNFSSRFTQQGNYYLTQLNVLWSYNHILANAGLIRTSNNSILTTGIGFKRKFFTVGLTHGFTYASPFEFKSWKSFGYGYGVWELNFSLRFGKKALNEPATVETW